MKKTAQPNWKTRVFHEFRFFLLLALMLFFFLCSFGLYRKLVLGESLTTIPFGYLSIQSLILAKIILLGKFLKLGERFSERSLIIPAVYKTVVFTLFILVFALLEHSLEDLFSGKTLVTLYEEYKNTNIIAILGKIPLVLFVALPFFCLAELSNALGKDKLYKLFFKRERSSTRMSK